MKKKRKGREWWRRPQILRRLAIAAISMLIIIFGASYLLLSDRHSDRETVLLESPLPAPRFTLATTAGTEFTSTEHLGRHNLLLYFNEGMG